MAFLLADERERPDSWMRYRAYLESMRANFPPCAWALATSEWYFDFTDHRCPHDAWLETITFAEPAGGERQQARNYSLLIRLLGAFHDGHIEFFYPHVYSYSLAAADSSHGHGDWRYDEFRLSERGYLLHEIEWRSAQEHAHWLIEASDVTFRWLPLKAA